MEQQEQRLLLFELDGTPDPSVVYALDLSYVWQVMVAEQTSPVPLSPPLVRGIVHYRGRVVTVVDIAELIGKMTTATRPSGSFVLLKRESMVAYLGLAVAKIREIVFSVDLLKSDLEAGEGVRWVGKLQDKIVKVLDVPSILAQIEAHFVPERRLALGAS